jgi:hypothetical protein
MMENDRIIYYQILSSMIEHFHSGLQILYEKTLKIFKFLNSECVVLFFDPKLLNKSATRFIPRWNLLNKTFIPPFWVGICMRGTLNTQNSKILSTPLSLKYKIVEWKCDQIYSMVTFVSHISIFPIQVSRAKLRFEVLFKRFHSTTLFLTKTYLLNTIKLFPDHENRSLGPKQQYLKKPLLGGYP